MVPNRRMPPLFWAPPLALLLAVGCTPSDPKAPGADETASSTATTDEADSPKEAGPAGTLTGTVTFDGDPLPQQTMIPIQTDPEYCERHGKDGVYPKEDCLIDADSRGVRNVIVYLMGDGLPGGEPQRQDIVVDNRDCRFEPHVNVSTVGSAVEVKNSDEIYHTTHLYGPPGFVEFNPGMRQKGDSEKTILSRPGLYLVKCDRHGWMSAFLRVDNHPFQAITDEQGRFEISGVPPGEYKLGMFHERFRPDAKDPEPVEVTIEADQTASADLKLSQ